MGIFDSKDVVSVGAAISPLLGERPNLIRHAVIKANISDVDYVPTIVDALMNGYNIKDEEFYRKGETGEYRLGLPNGHIASETYRYAEAKEVIAAEKNLTIADLVFTYEDYGKADAVDICKYIAQRELTYDPATDRYTAGLTTITSNPTYVAEIKSTSIDQGDGVGYDEGWQEDDYSAWAVVIFNVFDPNDRANTEVTESFERELMDDVRQPSLTYDTISNFMTRLYTIRYQLPDGAGGHHAGELVWLYDIGTDFYPELSIYSDVDINSPYYPIVPVRYDKEMVGPSHSLIYYQTLADEVDMMLKLVGIGREEIQEALQDNPDINDVDSAYVVFGIPFGSLHDVDSKNTIKTQADLKYLYRYITYLHDSIQTVDKATFEAAFGPDSPIYKPFNVLNIRDSGLSTQVYWNYIEIEELPLVEDTGETTYGNTGRKGDNAYGMSSYIVPDVRDKDEDGFYSNSALYFYFHDEDNNKTTKITFHGFYIYQEIYEQEGAVFTLWDSYFSDDTNGLYLPLSRDIIRTLSKQESQNVAFGSIILVTYAVAITKVKWYQRGAFLKILQVVLTVIAIYTQNYQLIAAATSITAIAYIIVQAVIIQLAVSAVLSVIFKVLIDVLGVEIAFILAIAALVVGAASLTDLIELGASMPDATVFIKIATMLSTAIQEDIADEFSKIKIAFKAFQDEAEKIREEIEEAQELLGPEGGVGLDVLIPAVIRYETPDAYYSRSMDMVFESVALDTIDNYYDNMLNEDF